MLGGSILLASTNNTWAAKRKAVSGAFYKAKLQAMSEFFKIITLKEVENLKNGCAKTGEAFDIVKFMSNLYVKILVKSAFGITDDVFIDFEHPDGKVEKLILGEFIKKTFVELTLRYFSPLTLLFPETATWYNRTASERILMRNVKRLR